MGLRARIAAADARRARAEATCQGCRQCAWGATFPCPTQSEAKRRELLDSAASRRRVPAKDLTGAM